MAKAGTILIDIKADTSYLVKSTEKAQRYVKRAIGNMQKTIGGLAVAYLSLQTAAKAFEEAAKMVNVAKEFERFENILSTIEGSSQKAQVSMKWINNFSKTTPFDLRNVTESFVKLKAYGIDPTTGTLRTLGNTASAMGKPMIQAVEAMADAMTGENERLKEFGIRASAMGEEVKYSWTNSSGEAREIIVENNSAVIQSTLNSIWNSSYQGAMDKQSKSLSGMLSNISGAWVSFQNDFMKNTGMYNYLKAITFVIGEDMSKAMELTSDNSKAYSNNLSESFRLIFESGALVIDVFRGIGNISGVVMDSIQASFWAVVWAINKASEYVAKAIDYVANTSIDTYNIIASQIDGMSTIGKIDLFSTVSSWSDASAQAVRDNINEIKTNLVDLSEFDRTWNYTQKLLDKSDIKYQEFKSQEVTKDNKRDFGNAVSIAKVEIEKQESSQTSYEKELAKQEEYTKNVLKNYYGTQTTTVETLDKTTDVVEKLNNTFISNNSNNDMYTRVTDTIGTLNDFSDSVNNIDYAVESATSSVEKFIFAFSDTLINSISSNAQTLYSIGSQKTGFTNISYQDALATANGAKDSLLSNPLDTDIAKTYETAFNQLIDSANNYLVAENFASTIDFNYAKAVASSQIDSFQEAALNSYTVLDSMNNLLSSINQSFLDGILSDAERADIKGVANEVNLKAQEYLVGSNSVSAFIKNLYGSNGKGISLDTINATFPELAVATNLNEDDLSNIDQSTIATVSAINNLGEYISNIPAPVVNVAGQTVTSVPAQKQAIVKSIPQYQYKWWNGGGYSYGAIPPLGSGAEKILIGYKDVVEYYADGGFTGKSNLAQDFTGQRPIKGLSQLHEEEWVAPRWMTKGDPQLFNDLEAVRQKGSFASGGFISGDTTLSANYIDNTKIVKLLEDIRTNTSKSRFAS